MLPPLDHYLRPTYYDVIYLQPVGESKPPSLSIDIKKKEIMMIPMLETNFNFNGLASRY